MKNLVILVDTNVIFDYYEERKGHFDSKTRRQLLLKITNFSL